MKKIMIISLLAVTTTLMAKPNIDPTKMKASLVETAGEKGVFAQNEVFPKDYFLISKNLPFLVGLTLHHPMSSDLNLSKEQIEKIQMIKGQLMPSIITSAKEIKSLEIALAQNMMEGKKASDMLTAVDKIAALKTALTKEHLKCIESVLAILTEDQKKKLLEYAGKAH
jgi:hypothetical protein